MMKKILIIIAMLGVGCNTLDNHKHDFDEPAKVYVIDSTYIKHREQMKEIDRMFYISLGEWEKWMQHKKGWEAHRKLFLAYKDSIEHLCNK